jgi:hypothetical protein
MFLYQTVRRGCVWTLGKGKPSWKPGESGDPAHWEGEKAGSWLQIVEEDRHLRMPQNTGDGLATTPSHVYAQSMYHCALCINYHINNHNRNHVLIVYLFQENKSFGSKKPFAFILWCTRSCVKHSFFMLLLAIKWSHTVHKKTKGRQRKMLSIRPWKD